MKGTEKKFNIKTAGGVFSIVLKKWGEDKGYIVRVPKFPEIITQGSSIKEAKLMAKEAIDLCTECNDREIKKHGDYSYSKSKRSSSVTASSRL
ncbi:MAG: type II toxin-antitoxin system HicB family antitoxin [Parcubacteria group bacterium]|nr:type II toxin-antitoxin system HicB family antitoxin [Parcubacteria group bacterium]